MQHSGHKHPVLTSLTAALLLVCGCTRQAEETQKSYSPLFSQYMGPVVLRMAEQSPHNHPGAMASQYFADMVAERTEGKIRIKVYYDGKLGNTKAVIEQLKFGGIALSRISLAELTDAVPSLQHEARIWMQEPVHCRSSIIKNFHKVEYDCQTEKLYPLSIFYPELRCFYTDSINYIIKTEDTLPAIRIGTVSSKIIQEQLLNHGAVPVDIVSEDTYRSMRNGYLNVRESSLSDFLVSNDYQFINYITLSDYIANPDLIIISNETINDLSVQQRAILADCAQKASEYQGQTMRDFYRQHLPVLQRKKTVLQEIKAADK